MGNEGKNGKVPLISKIAYGFGDVGCNFSWMFVSGRPFEQLSKSPALSENRN